MYKKRLSSNFVLFFSFLIMFFLGSINISAKQVIKLKECEYTEEYKRYINLSDEEKKNVIIPQMCKINTQTSLSLGASLGSVDAPKFDLRDKYVTSIKNQETTNLCWAFAANASIESNLLVNNLGTYDLSESHMDILNQNTYELGHSTFNRKIGMGGNSYIAAAYVMNNRGPVLEEDVPFKKSKDLISDNLSTVDITDVTDKKSKISVNNIALINNNNSVCSKNDLSTSEMKKYLVNYGAVTANTYFESDNKYMESNGKNIFVSDYLVGPYYYYNGKEDINHAVTIVGWDDTISKDNFKSDNKPTEDGAWIVKNSYGTKNTYKTTSGNVDIESGDNGYYYISYEDSNICKSIASFYDTSLDVEDNVYYYDELGFSSAVYADKDLYTKNIFYKKTDRVEKLSKVAFYNLITGSNYEVYYAIEDEEPIKIASGISDHSGYVSVKINDDILIDQEEYAIIIKYSALNGKAILPIMAQTNTGDFFSTAEITENVSFISYDMNNWADLSKKFNANLLIKAYTNNVENTQIKPTTTKKSEDENNDLDYDENNDEEVSIEIVPNENNNGQSYIQTTEKNPSTGEISIVFITFMFLCLAIAIIFSILKLKK